MAVQEKFDIPQGHTWRNGLTWGAMTTRKGGFDKVPCYELEWDDEGNPSHTGRFAMKSMTHIERSWMPYASLNCLIGEQPEWHDDDLIGRDEAVSTMRERNG